MEIVNFTPIESTLGGALIGLSASMLLFFHGRVAGISGIVGGGLTLPKGDMSWRVLFLVGLVVGGFIVTMLAPRLIGSAVTPVGATVVAGVLVGFGTRMGNGCTSGHGICGLSRLSSRSLFAVLSFMAIGFGTASILHGAMGVF
jgi:uncharacterized membrane protein YedE/YeeE